MEENKNLSFVEKMKLKTQQQKKYGDDKFQTEQAKLDTQDCPNCGAGRAKHEGITHCAYCGYEFISNKLDEGIYIKKEDNSQKF
ncbi:eL43 family ribosomal protein [Capnocytophaga cynodegmi]|uniref:Uncharacterized protein n=1 Tax=Capnocytophaga cynodegmi TaxID=28189 RepID=A0A0B7HIZ4_9FLAO|nr:hypothetical protein [Capnocytophaga cynodegmi]CEN36227.1 conserved hypothetical protein [Capnocytophaga cynodegmi]CEN38624.1 conserved hypothetical protein [Capnocytophaga cynodegmi]